MPSTAPTPPRAPWQVGLCIVFLAGAIADLSLIAQWLLGNGGEPVAIVVWHGVTMATAVSCLVAVWQRRSWAPYAVAAWGVANTTLVLSVPLLVEVPPEAVPGIWGGAAAVGLLTGVCVWVVVRNMRR